MQKLNNKPSTHVSNYCNLIEKLNKYNTDIAATAGICIKCRREKGTLSLPLAMQPNTPILGCGEEVYLGQSKDTNSSRCQTFTFIQCLYPEADNMSKREKIFWSWL